jgi:hypothetical protein
MKKRSPVAVLLLPFVTFGIYGIYWQVKTKVEMNSVGASIPTAWLLIVPIVNIWWLWKYSEGVDKVTNGKMSGVLAFILLFLLGFIGGAIIQSSFNQVASGAPAPAAAPMATPTTGGDMAAAPGDSPMPAPDDSPAPAPSDNPTPPPSDSPTPPPAAG